MKKTLLTLAATVTLSVISLNAAAADYMIDKKGAHAFINFKIKHLGYSWLTGRFNDFSGTFSYDDKDTNASKIEVDIVMNSIDSNHQKRDDHLRSADFLDVEKYKDAKFVSTKIVDKGDNNIDVIGDLTLHGVTKSVTIDAEKIGEGKDPWGGYRAGFSGTTTLKLADFNISEKVGPEVMLELHIEGIRI
ncbi:MAG: YceI family protein [Arenicella sp.]